MHVIPIYYIQLLYVNIIMFKKCQEHDKIIFIKDQKNCETNFTPFFLKKSKINLTLLFAIICLSFSFYHAN